MTYEARALFARASDQPLYGLVKQPDLKAQDAAPNNLRKFCFGIEGLSRAGSISAGSLMFCVAMVLWIITTLQLKQFSPPAFEKGSWLAELFAHPPAPSYQFLYVFSVTNYDKWKSGKEKKLSLTEYGPYVFRMDITRRINWSIGNASFVEELSIHFEPSRSNGTLNDRIVTVNFPIVLLDHEQKPKSGSLFINTTVGKYFYSGFMNTSVDPESALNTSHCPVVNANHTFAMFGRLNSTTRSQYKIHTTAGSVNQLIAVHKNNNLSTHDHTWSNVTGALAGIGLSPAFQQSPQSLTIYDDQLCVPWTLCLRKQYNLDYEPISRFAGSKDMFNAAQISCKSFRPTNDNGLFDASTCYTCQNVYNSLTLPAVLSFPHFLYGHSKLHHRFTGLRPNEKKHGVYIDVHAPSGIVIDMRVRSQLNFNLSLQRKRTRVHLIVPVFWQEILKLPEGKAKMLTAAKAWPVFAGWMAIACGLSLLLAALFFGIAIFVEDSLECCDFDEEDRPHTPDDIPTEELSSEPEEDLRREQRRRALRARLPAGLPVYFKIHKGDLDDLGVAIPEWVMEKLQKQIEEQGSSSSSEDSSDELSPGSPSWSTVSSRSTSAEREQPKGSPSELLQSQISSKQLLRSLGPETPESTKEEEDADEPKSSSQRDEEEVHDGDSA